MTMSEVGPFRTETGAECTEGEVRVAKEVVS